MPGHALLLELDRTPQLDSSATFTSITMTFLVKRHLALKKIYIQQNSNFRYFLAVNRKVKVRPLIITYSIKVKVHNIASSVQGDPVCLLRIGIDND